jgi:hypothetical protein
MIPDRFQARARAGRFRGAARLMLALVAALLVCPGPAAGARAAKKLIEAGWDEPDPAFVRAHAAEMERTPFDGCLIHLDYANRDGTTGNFTWEFWGRRAFKPEELRAALRDLRATRFRRFNSNFLRVNATPGDIDWFDDFSPVLKNARLAASIARAGGCRGIVLDNEHYKEHVFEYRRQRLAASKRWDQYAAQARRRGRELMREFQSAYPKITVVVPFGYDAVWGQHESGRRSLADCEYGLLAPFLDGMMDALGARATLVDAYEQSYGFRDTSQFTDAYHRIKRRVLPIVGPRRKYSQRISAGFCVWLDYDWRTSGWNTEDVSKNYFPPAVFGASVREALRTSDEFVFIYSETPRWWTAGGVQEKLPAVYDSELRRARHGAERGP